MEGQQQQQQQYVDPHNPNPSPVVHIRNLARNATDQDIMTALQPFGQIVAVMIMTGKGQALVEYSDPTGASSIVSYARNNPVYICGQPAFYNYSTSQKIKREGEAHSGSGTGAHGNIPEGRILLLTILNCQYPITPDILYTICMPHGRILRIVIFRKNGVQAMVEFDAIDGARNAKAALSGCDIYSGCCTLRIEWAKATRLNVFKNDHETWDYEAVPPGSGPPPDKKTALLSPPAYGGFAPPAPRPGIYQPGASIPGAAPGVGLAAAAASPVGAAGPGAVVSQAASGAAQWEGAPLAPWPYGAPQAYPPHAPYDFFSQMPPPPANAHQAAAAAAAAAYAGQMPRPVGALPQTQQNCVIMVYGLNPAKMSCDMVFNLYCLFGNVVRIKFLKSMEGSCMVQMGDQVAVERCMQYLDNLYFFGHTMQLGHSKQSYLQEVVEPYALQDGTPSFKDYTSSRNNRFQTSHQAAKNRLLPPSRILHFFNAPMNIDDDCVKKVFNEANAAPPTKVSRFSAKSERTATGQCEYNTVAEGVEALCIANHKTVFDTDGKNPHTLRLCFFMARDYE